MGRTKKEKAPDKGDKPHNKLDIKSKWMSIDFDPPVLAKNYDQYQNSDCNISVVGSLAKNVGFWREINCPEHILHIIEKGYTIPLVYMPKPKFLRNNKSSRTNATFVRGAIDDLLHKGAIEERATAPKVVNPLTVAQKGIKSRLVLDLWYINKYVHKQRCKIEGSETLAKYLPSSTHLFGFDLKAGYHHVQVNPIQWELLGFSYSDHKGVRRYFVFKVLPFGLTSAGYIFTKVLRVLIQRWRQQQICILAFFDDGIGAVYSLEQGIQHSLVVKSDLIAAGFVPNARKCKWLPVPVLEWLGLIHDLIQMKIFVTKEKLSKASELLSEVLAEGTIHVKHLAKVTSTLISMQGAYGDIIYLKSKRLQMIIAESDDWDRMVTLTEPSKNELQFWLHYLPRNNGFPISAPIASGAVSYSDASRVGLAAVITPYPNQQEIVVHKEFSEQEKGRSSTFRELLAVLHGLQYTKHLLKNQAIKWHTDAKNLIPIIRKGSMIPNLLEMSLEIFEITKEYNICLSMSWIKETCKNL